MRARSLGAMLFLGWQQAAIVPWILALCAFILLDHLYEFYHLLKLTSFKQNLVPFLLYLKYRFSPSILILVSVPGILLSH